MKQLLDKMASWDARGGPLDWPDDDFTELARDLFRTHFESNAPYRSFCEKRGVTPNEIRSYRDIPAVPTDVFKHVRLTTAGEPVRTFRTSGTTLGRRGEHHFGTLEAYQASLVGPFRRFCLPDTDTMRMLVVAPSGAYLPDSSLSFMLDELVERFGDDRSEFFVCPDASGELEMRFDELRAALDEAAADGVTTMLLGTAFGFIEFFDSCDHTWQLPAGSRVMETGGFKGKSRDASREELYRMFQTRLGIPQVMCVSEYSMTELSSQAYTDNLWRHLESGARHGARDDVERPFNMVPGTMLNGDSAPSDATSTAIWALRTPPWARVEIVDPLDFSPMTAPGKKGLIRWYDLANTESVVAVQTSDMGVLVEGSGFRLLGRAPDSELRGCSLTIEEIVGASTK